jgi:hypothetical protein
LGVVAIVVIVAIGLLIAKLVTKIVTRGVVLLVVVVLGFTVYNQRAKVVEATKGAASKCEAAFFGVHVAPSDPNIKKACKEAGKLHK